MFANLLSVFAASIVSAVRRRADSNRLLSSRNAPLWLTCFLLAANAAYGQTSKGPEDLCNKGGHAAECNDAGLRYAKGTGVARDLPKALELLVKACDEGFARDCLDAGMQYSRGQGVTKDHTRAAELYVKGCQG